MRRIEQELEKYQLGAAPNDLILKQVNKTIYQTNGFRILDIRNININNRELNEEFEEKKLDLELDDEGVDLNSYLFSPPSKPNLIDLTNAKNRLMNSQIRFIDEIFWFWPQHQNYPQIEDPALDSNSIEISEEIWKNRVLMESESMTSMHNLAALYHAQALDLELAGDKNNQQLWQKSMSNWRILFDNRKFWDLVKKRVQELKDPQLRDEVVHNMISTLPIAILLVQKDFIINATLNKNKSEIQKHISIIKNSKFEDKFIKEALERTAEILRAKNEENCKLVIDKTQTNPGETKKTLEGFITETESLFFTLDQLLTHRPEVINAEHDRAANTLYNSTTVYVMETTDPAEQGERIKKCKDVLKRCLKWTSDERIKDEIEKIMIVIDNPIPAPEFEEKMNKIIEKRNKLDELITDAQKKTTINPNNGISSAKELISKGKPLLNELTSLTNEFLNTIPDTDPLKTDIQKGLDIAHDDIAVIASNCIFADLNSIDPQNRNLAVSKAKEALPLLKDAITIVKTSSKEQELQKQIDLVQLTLDIPIHSEPPKSQTNTTKVCVAAILGVVIGAGIGYYYGGWWWGMAIILPIIFTSLLGGEKK